LAQEENSLVTINQLDMDAIAQYVLAKEKLVYREDAPGTNATDTDKVDGVPSNQIAQAIDSSHRNTVQNALQLGGIDAKNYMQVSTGADLSSNVSSIQETYGKDIQDLRDELYQLKNQLAKNGFVRNDGQYMGFHDIFKINNYVHNHALLCKASTQRVTSVNQIQIDNTEVFASIDVYDYIALKNTALDETFVKQVIAKGTDGETLTLDSDIELRLQAQEYEVYKSDGIVYNSEFKFAKPPENQLGSNEFYSGVSDDSFNSYKRLCTPNTGFGYGFKVPEGKTGWLSDIELCLRAYGNPGALICYVIDERDIPSFRNPAQAEAAYKTALEHNDKSWHFFAKSQPYVLNASMGKRYCKFSFLQDGIYPLIEIPEENEIVRYTLIVELQSGDDNNYYNLLFLQHHNADGTLSDLQLNNTTYTYTSTGSNADLSALQTDATINSFDIFYQLHTIENVKNEPIANRDGLYSAYIYTKPNIHARRAVLEMRIRREGSYHAVGEAAPKSITTQAVPVVNENAAGIRTLDDLSLKSEITKPKEIRTGDGDISQTVHVAIGNNIATINSMTDSSFTVNSPIMLINNSPVYRIGYWVAVKACRLNFDATTGIISKTNFKRINMPLTEIISDIERTDIETSDRLLFEADIPKDIANTCNYFELQVYWENHLISSYHDIRNAQMGAIKELTFSINSYASSSFETNPAPGWLPNIPEH
jgi:hypothetical protein